MFKCPQCNVPIGEVSEDGRLDAICPQCRYRFGVVTGALESTNERTHSASKNPYELHLVVAGNQRQIVRHSAADLANWSQNRLRHTLAVTFTMRGAEVEDLLAIQDQTSGDTIKVSNTGKSVRATAWTCAAGTFVATFFVSAALSGSSTSYLIALLAAIVGYHVGAERAAPRVKLTSADQQRLEALQVLLTKKLALVDARGAAITDHNSKIGLMNQVNRLADRMHALDQRVYARRIERLGAAFRLLGEQAQIDRDLAGGYDKTIAMIDIEVQSLATVGEVTESASGTIDAKIAELDALRDDMRERERMLGANEELETFLEVSSQPPLPQGKGLEEADDYAPGIPLEHLFDEPADEEDES